MAFIVEDGTGKPDANSFASVEFADSYFADRNIIAWSGSEPEKQGWLIQATDYIITRFYGRFYGEMEYSADPAQALPYPRIVAYVSVGMPLNLLKATAEYALRAKKGSLAPDAVYTASGQVIQAQKKKVGPIETETTYASGTGGSANLLRPYPAADMLLKGLVRSSGGREVIRN